MKRKALLALAAAGAITAIVVLTTGAFAGTSGRSDQPGDGNAAFISCLASHGVQVPSDDPGAVKRWLGDHQSEPAVQAALDACAPPDGGSNADVSGPTPAELVACLEQHGVDVPSDVKDAPATIKEWLHGAIDQPSVKAAVDECAGGPAPNGKKSRQSGWGRRRGDALPSCPSFRAKASTCRRRRSGSFPPERSDAAP